MFKSGLSDGHNHPLRAALGNDRDASPTAGGPMIGVVRSSLMALGVTVLDTLALIEGDRNVPEMDFHFEEGTR